MLEGDLNEALPAEREALPAEREMTPRAPMASPPQRDEIAAPRPPVWRGQSPQPTPQQQRWGGAPLAPTGPEALDY